MFNENNPIQALGFPTPALQMNAYRQRMDILKQSLNEQVLPKPQAIEQTDPFAPKEQDPEAEQAKAHSQRELWLAPTAQDIPQQDPEVQAKKQAHFEHHFQNDPAINEALPLLEPVMNQLLGEVNAGRMTADQAHQLCLQFADENLESIIDKHHPKGSASYHTSMLSEPVPETPKLLKKQRGIK